MIQCINLNLKISHMKGTIITASNKGDNKSITRNYNKYKKIPASLPNKQPN